MYWLPLSYVCSQLFDDSLATGDCLVQVSEALLGQDTLIVRSNICHMLNISFQRFKFLKGTMRHVTIIRCVHHLNING